MLMEINFSSEVPIYEQIRGQVIKGIANDQINLGQTLPSVRQLAEDLGVNLHTVNKAYKLLQADGFIEMDRRFGTKVVEKRPKLQDELKDYIKEEMSFLVSLLKATDSDMDQLIDFIKEKYQGGKEWEI